ncbi:tail fiber assembly protein [Pseudomonas sp. KU26590]|uniref:tail fiber assembly protein n=1 Tax=Pseudomonas sp. KU26590 TaxID=2991051 RepID=UPI00223DA107|nr:tail fiber assembly protein [Pseudomonas sp. KU26590]UZJ58542.1 tail fiber assembly protein [Pseudomonas sp. KU26590]
MGNYAIIQDGSVINTTIWDGNTETWSPPDGQLAVQIPEGLAVTVGTQYKDGAFFIEYAEVSPDLVPTPADILRKNTIQRDALLSIAALAIAPLQDAVDLEMATAADVALLKKWKQYRVEVNRTKITEPAPSWPSSP